MGQSEMLARIEALEARIRALESRLAAMPDKRSTGHQLGAAIGRQIAVALQRNS